MTEVGRLGALLRASGSLPRPLTTNGIRYGQAGKTPSFPRRRESSIPRLFWIPSLRGNDGYFDRLVLKKARGCMKAWPDTKWKKLSDDPKRFPARHSRAGGYPVFHRLFWFPACAGMTGILTASS
jgi:hypothetical protein